MKIIRPGLRRKIFPVMIMTVILLLSLLNCTNSEATRRSLSLNDFMEESFIQTRTVEINGRIFDVLINRSDKSITVRGIVEDWEEKDRVEQYFRLRAPSDFQINYEITLVY